MSARDLRVVFAVVAGIAGLGACSGGGDSSAAPRGTVAAEFRRDAAPAHRRNEDPRAARFRAALEADGFVVQEGTLPIADPLSSMDWHAIDSACGNNAGQFYKRFVVPPHPAQGGEAADTFKLAENEAVVYVGRTPPRGDYFSFCPMLWARYPGVRVVATGDWVFASVGDPLNNALIRTQGNGNPFHKDTVVVFTADDGVYERIAASAVAGGWAASTLNRYVLPWQVLRMGNGELDDSLFFLLRTANFTSEAEGARYLADDAWATVWRVTPKRAPAPRLAERVPPRNRLWIHERELVPGIEAGLERLEAAILARHSEATAARRFASIRWFFDSFEVLEDDPASDAYRAFVAGESSDTPYLRSAEGGAPAHFVLGEDDLVVVYGVNHAATGLATYSNFGVYGDWVVYPCPEPGTEPLFRDGCGDRIWNGVVSMTSHAFTGSAEAYLPGDPMAPYLYAVRVVRAARAVGRDRWRVVVPEPTPWPLPYTPLSADGIPLDAPAMIGYRAYLNPATASGPAYEDLVPDRALWFRVE